MSLIKDELISLLQCCVEHLQSTTSNNGDGSGKESSSFSPILYRTIAALHAYSLEQIGVAPVATSARPSYQKGTIDDILASGWIEEMASAASIKSKAIVWKPVLALLVQKEKEEPCLWITREVMTESGTGEPELETMHRIPMRRLQSIEFVDFYGDYRLAINVKRRDADLIFRCQDSWSAKQWVEQLERVKVKGRHKTSSAAAIAVGDDDAIEVEMNDDSLVNVESHDSFGSPEGHDSPLDKGGLSNSFLRDDDFRLNQEEHDMKLSQVTKDEIDESNLPALQKEEEGAQLQSTKDENQQNLHPKAENQVQLENSHASVEGASVQWLKDENERNSETMKKNPAQAEKMHASGDESSHLKSLLAGTNAETKSKSDLDDNFKKTQQQQQQQKQRNEQERVAKQAQVKATLDQQRQKVEQPQITRSIEDQRRLAELAIEQQKKAAAEERRRELERQRRLAQEEQKKLEQEERRKFLEKEQRKQDLINKAKAGKTAMPPKGPVFSGVMDKLNSQMSALEAADADRKRTEEAKRKEEEQKSSAKPESPESARKRIADEARQRIALEETERASKALHDKGEINGLGNEVKHGDGLQTLPNITPSDSVRQGPGQIGSEHQRFQMPAAQMNATIPQGQFPASPSSQQGRVRQMPDSATSHFGQNSAQPQTFGPQQGIPSMNPLWNQWQQQKEQPQRPTTQIHSFPQQQFMLHQRQQHQQTHTQSTPAMNANQAFPKSPTPPSYPSRNNAHFHPTAPKNPSGVNLKYKQMAQQVQDDPSAVTALKRSILFHWALQPPSMQILRPVDQLVANIHCVLPPAFGVAPHSYFSGFQAILPTELTGAAGALDKDKLGKAVRKVRFFLHPDKLPRDLSDDQQFMCKLLWDVTNDAWEDYKKSLEELDWLQ